MTTAVVFNFVRVSENICTIDGFTLERGIMDNQGKISRKQGSKIYVFLHISVLISNLVTKHIQYGE